MLDIMRVFACLSQRLSTTELRQLTRVTEALLAMSGRVTMRGPRRTRSRPGPVIVISTASLGTVSAAPQISSLSGVSIDVSGSNAAASRRMQFLSCMTG
jgi:hypothetical protein